MQRAISICLLVFLRLGSLTFAQSEPNPEFGIEVGDVRPDIPGKEVIVGDRFYLPCLRAQLLLFDARGNRLAEVPGVAITGNPNLGVLQWDGRPVTAGVLSLITRRRHRQSSVMLRSPRMTRRIST